MLAKILALPMTLLVVLNVIIITKSGLTFPAIAECFVINVIILSMIYYPKTLIENHIKGQDR